MAKGPVLVGSGVSIDNINRYMSSDAVIIGTNFKINENWENAVAKEKVDDFMRKLEKIQRQKY